jgi:hypothetical protein
MRTVSRLTTVLVGLGLLVAGLVGVAEPASAVPNPTITVPATVAPRSQFQISGTGFAPGYDVTINVTDSQNNTARFGEVVTDSVGGFSLIDSLASNLVVGRLTFNAQGVGAVVLATAISRIPAIVVTQQTNPVVPNGYFSVDIQYSVDGGFKFTLDATVDIPVVRTSPDQAAGLYASLLLPAVSLGTHTLTVEDVSFPFGTTVWSSATISFTVSAPWISVSRIDPAGGIVNTYPWGFPNGDPLAIGYYDSSSTFHTLATTTSSETGGAYDNVPLTQLPGPTARLTYLDTSNQQTISVVIDHTGVLKPDLLATSADGRLWYYANNGTGTPYVTPQIIGAGGWQNFNHIVAGDVNADGKIDLVATSVDGEYDLASEVLMPEDDFRLADLSDLDAIQAASEEFKVTPSAVVMRAQRLKLFSREVAEVHLKALKDAYDTAQKTPRRAMLRMNALKKYNGTECSRRMLTLYDSGGLSKADFCRVMFSNTYRSERAINDFRAAL